MITQVAISCQEDPRKEETSEQAYKKLVVRCKENRQDCPTGVSGTHSGVLLAMM